MLDVPQSGSQGGITSSRNRFGQYKRTRAIPVNPASSFQGTVRNRMSVNSAAWRALTAVQRSGWETLGAAMSRTDALGQTYTLNGFLAYCSVNNNNLAAGNAVVADAPALVTPSGLLTATVTATTATLSIAYTATPLAAGLRLFAYASPCRSAGRTFEGDLRLIQVSAAAAASPLSIFTAYAARFGAPTTGSALFTSCQIYSGGFLSGPLMGRIIVA